ncbi:MAG: aspartate 1-decarboxylase [Candidatus Omnitrophica bacterium]|nr:aspartate 1-decarboxylase [Candidatus Omnitrophota bacterium]
MLRTMLKSKIYHATVTEAQLHYKGSITIDEDIIEKAGLLVNEKVEVLNMNNGLRIETYVIKGKRGSGVICLNGPAARTGVKGDKLVVLAYGIYDEDEVKKLKPNCVELDDANKIKNIHVA